MQFDKSITNYWQKYCTSLQIDKQDTCLNEGFDAWAFDNTKESANAMLKLVLEGKKTATAGLVWEAEYSKWKMPKVGDKVVILDGDQQPACIIEYTSVDIKPFKQVTYDFAKLEGEGDTCIEDWWENHGRYFTSRCKAIGKEPSDDMEVMCQVFKVIYS